MDNSHHMNKLKGSSMAILICLTLIGFSASYAHASSTSKELVVGAPECAHCLAMSLIGPTSGPYHFTFKPFGTLSAITTALLTGHIQIAQIDYPSLVSLISKKAPIVAISGQVNGGSDLVLSPSIKVSPNNWAALRHYVLKNDSPAHPFRIASNFGTVQDVDLRLRLSESHIPMSHLDIINVPFPGMSQAIKTGTVQAAVPVQPFAAEMTTTGIAKHFSYLYDQPAGKLTNVVIVSKSFLNAHPEAVNHIADAMVKLISYIKTDAGRHAWAAAIEKYTYISHKAVTYALSKLTPDINIPLGKVQAIANAMYARHLISRNLSTTDLLRHIDYQPLEQATSKSRGALGGPK